ncbi:MAG: cytochrome P450 [Chloroflexi bacterium]|nr:cytochrome P450 [Chloroflexota bacterium]
MLFARSKARDLNLADAAVRQDPYPIYAELRRTDPVALVKMPFFGDTYFISRYEDVAATFKDPRISNDTMGSSSEHGGWLTPRSFRLMAENMLSKDDPEHRRLRDLVHKAFTPSRIRSMVDRVEEITHELLDRAAEKRDVDLIADFALPIPLIIISEMLGVEAKDREPFHHMTARFLESTNSGVMQMVLQTPNINRMVRFFERLLEDRRANLGDDLLSALIEAEQEGDRLSQDELIGMIFLLLLAGHETTVNLIGSGLLALLEHPDEFARLHNDPDLIDSAIEELLRYTNPVELSAPRFPLEDIEMHGVIIPQGHRMLVGVASANRDETVFENPDAVDITRKPNRHLAFGLGVHYCLGAPLARLEGATAINAIVQRFPEMQLMKPINELEWRSSTLVRGLKSLPVRV